MLSQKLYQFQKSHERPLRMVTCLSLIAEAITMTPSHLKLARRPLGVRPTCLLYRSYRRTRRLQWVRRSDPRPHQPAASSPSSPDTRHYVAYAVDRGCGRGHEPRIERHGSGCLEFLSQFDNLVETIVSAHTFSKLLDGAGSSSGDTSSTFLTMAWASIRWLSARWKSPRVYP